MPKSKDYTPFPGHVCEYLRNLLKERTKQEALRKGLFDVRDNADVELRRTDISDTYRVECSAKYGAAVRDIIDAGKRVKWINGEIERVVTKADEPELFETVDVHFPKFGQDQELSDEEVNADTRPVGRPAKAPAARAEDTPLPPEGQDQHLTADVKELDIREDLIGKLKLANLGTVGAVHKAILDETDLGGLLQVGQNLVSQIKAAVKKFIKAHRNADRSVNADPIPIGRGRRSKDA